MSEMPKSRTAILLYANPETNADILYFGEFHAPDPFLAIGVGRRRIGVLSPLEIGRAKKQSGFTDILNLMELRKETESALGIKKPTPADCAVYLANKENISTYRVPQDFPLGMARGIEKQGIHIEVDDAPFFPDRLLKNDEQAAAIKAGNALSSVGFKLFESMLKRARADKKGRLVYEGDVLTSERVQTAIAKAILDHGGVASNTIVAGGDQACDPHERGSGPLFANELIIVDIFPRVSATCYHGDMTRTYLKGKASKEQTRLVKTVRKAQKAALATVRARVHGHSIHQEVVRVFDEKGYETKQVGGTYQGFFHGTGHGLGLEVHEGPRVSPGGGPLKAGMVVTIEPGLYYPGLGGCRIEDVVRVTQDGCEMLSDYSYKWEIA